MQQLQVVLKGQKGSTPVIIVCTTLIIILASAFVADLLYGAVLNYKLSDAAGKAAVEGANVLLGSREEAISVAKAAAVNRIQDLSELDVKISDSNDEITVYLKSPFSYRFLSILGFEAGLQEAKVTVKMGGVSSYKGIRPLVLEKKKIVFGKSVALISDKREGPDKVPFILPVLPGDLKSSIAYGFRSKLSLGDKLSADLHYNTTAAAVSISNLIDTYKNQKPSNRSSLGNETSNLMILPLVSKLDYSGLKSMEVTGFAAFSPQSIKTEKGNIELKGSFVKYLVKSEITDQIDDPALMGIKIIR